METHLHVGKVRELSIELPHRELACARAFLRGAPIRTNGNRELSNIVVKKVIMWEFAFSLILFGSQLDYSNR